MLKVIPVPSSPYRIAAVCICVDLYLPLTITESKSAIHLSYIGKDLTTGIAFRVRHCDCINSFCYHRYPCNLCNAFQYCNRIRIIWKAGRKRCFQVHHTVICRKFYLVLRLFGLSGCKISNGNVFRQAIYVHANLQ